MPTNNVYKMSVVTFYSTDQQWNVFHFRQNGTGDTETGLAADFIANIVPTWKAQVSNTIFFSLVRVIKLYPYTGIQYDTFMSGNGTITASPALPPQMAAILTWKSGYIGRRRRGRSYIGGFTTDASAGGLLSSAGQTRLANLGTAIHNRYVLGSATPYHLVVYSRLVGLPDYSNAQNAWVDVIDRQPQSTWGVQRRRRFGYGV